MSTPDLSSSAAQSLSAAQRNGLRIAQGAWLALIALCVLWELWLAPIRPGGSWLVLKALPLLLPIRGVFRGDLKSLQWALMLVLLYLMEGAVRAGEPAPYGTLAWIELLLVTVFFIAAIAYVRPFKQAARALKKSQPRDD